MSSVALYVLDDFRVTIPARDLVTVSPIVGGALALCVKCSDGEEVEIVMSEREMREHVLRCEDAMDLGRVLK